MRRRRFTLGLLLTAVARPTRAQLPAKQHRIAIVTSVIPAFLMTETNGDAGSRALFEELRRLGYVEGHNLVVERYSAEGHPERLPQVAGEVVRPNPDLIFATGDAVAAMLGAATRSIPIVVTAPDPLRSGLSPAWRAQGATLPVSALTPDWKSSANGHYFRRAMEYRFATPRTICPSWLNDVK